MENKATVCHLNVFGVCYIIYFLYRQIIPYVISEFSVNICNNWLNCCLIFVS